MRLAKFLVFLILCCEIFTCFAQRDSIAVSKAHWKVEKIERGLLLKQRQFKKSVFQSNQYISIVQVNLRRKLQLELAADEAHLRRTSDFGNSAKALAAINGGFFDVKNGGSLAFVKSMGHILAHKKPINDKRSYYQKAALIIDGGKAEIKKWDGSDSWESNLSGQDILVTGPLLIYDRKFVSVDTVLLSGKTRAPRSAIATINKKVLLVTVDGRNENADGMTLYEFSRLLNWLHADCALNLDGGGSSTLWVSGRTGNGVVNFPSDNKSWDHEGERKVANAILVKKTEKRK